MTIFLYKPHVTGPTGTVTSPDVIVDHAFVDGFAMPLTQLTSDAWLQTAEDETARGAYAVVAIGGGALLAPAVVLGDGTVSIARFAWRLSGLDDRIEEVTLNSQPLADVGLPADTVSAVCGDGDALPRGFLVIHSCSRLSWEAVLVDAAVGRRLAHKVHGVPVGFDRWGGARPRPRYAVGPTRRDVTHYI